MIRRDFLGTSALLGSFSPLLFSWKGNPEGFEKADASPSIVHYDFLPYRENDTLCPVLRVTPDNGYYLHTFYDVCPWSPSQRYLACTKFPFQDREPNYRDKAQICVIDLQEELSE